MLIVDGEAFDLDPMIEHCYDDVKNYPEEIVSFLAPTTPEVVVLFFAIWKAGKIARPINHKFTNFDAPLYTPPKIGHKKPTLTPWKTSQLATLVATSGTTGDPKWAAHTLDNHIYSALGSQKMIPLEPGDKWLLTLPLHHIGGIAILMRCYLSGADLVIANDRRQGTHISLVPTQLYRLQQQNFPIHHFKTILLGGAPLPLTVPPNCKKTYGLTEMSSQVATDGHVLPYAQVKLVNDEIFVRGETLFQGYWNKGELIKPFDIEGWFATKDLGMWAGDLLENIGRKDNMFIRGGENIYPEAIESVLKTSPLVREAIVIPTPDPEYGASPILFIDPLISLELVHQILKNKLPKFTWPIAVHHLECQDLKPIRSLLIASNQGADR